jgi:hypothetical protein
MDSTEKAIWMSERLSQRFAESSSVVAVNSGHLRELFGFVPENLAFQQYQDQFRYNDPELEQLVALALIKVDLDKLLFGPEALLFIHPEFVLQFFTTLKRELQTVATIAGQRLERLQTLITSLVNSPEHDKLMTTQFENPDHQKNVDSLFIIVMAMTDLIHRFKPHQTDISVED